MAGRTPEEVSQPESMVTEPMPDEKPGPSVLFAAVAGTLIGFGWLPLMSLVGVRFEAFGYTASVWAMFITLLVPPGLAVFCLLLRQMHWARLWFITCLVSVVVAVLLVPGGIRARAQGQVSDCKSNLKNLGTAMEMYSIDFGGRYPPSSSLLTPNYLKTLPTCPAAGEDTYSAGFVSASDPNLYTVVCRGQHHTGAGVSGDYPQYTSVRGLIDRP